MDIQEIKDAIRYYIGDNLKVKLETSENLFTIKVSLVLDGEIISSAEESIFYKATDIPDHNIRR